jgi:adenylate cyclase, class 2
MTAAREIEIKLFIPDVKAIRRKLKALGFQVVSPRRFESNQLFDFPDQQLRKTRSLLRLRFEADDCLMTFKGPPLQSPRYKVRAETETRVADGRAARDVLRSLGLRESFRYDKYRTTFAPRRAVNRRKPPLAELDETPLGAYLELEGPPRWIDMIARGLGYAPEEYITASYAALYFEKCRREGKRPGNMVFVARR